MGSLRDDGRPVERRRRRRDEHIYGVSTAPPLASAAL